ncbi:MAG: putative damage-inducible protein DinB [Arenicella sp.]|jgi:uncharacterized damage-inducible protein DinB
MNKTEFEQSEFESYYGRYIDKLPESRSLREGFVLGKKETIAFFQSVPEDKLNYRYEEGKWSVKEVFQHLIDTERIFVYRAFRIARRDQTSLAGFDQDVYVAPSNANKKSLSDLVNEFEATRNYSISLINSLSDEDLKTVGVSSNKPMSARASLFTIIGHYIWHTEVIKERYL